MRNIPGLGITSLFFIFTKIALLVKKKKNWDLGKLITPAIPTFLVWAVDPYIGHLCSLT